MAANNSPLLLLTSLCSAADLCQDCLLLALFACASLVSWPVRWELDGLGWPHSRVCSCLKWWGWLSHMSLIIQQARKVSSHSGSSCSLMRNKRGQAPLCKHFSHLWLSHIFYYTSSQSKSHGQAQSHCKRGLPQDMGTRKPWTNWRPLPQQSTTHPWPKVTSFFNRFKTFTLWCTWSKADTNLEFGKCLIISGFLCVCLWWSIVG